MTDVHLLGNDILTKLRLQGFECGYETVLGLIPLWSEVSQTVRSKLGGECLNEEPNLGALDRIFWEETRIGEQISDEFNQYK